MYPYVDTVKKMTMDQYWEMVKGNDRSFPAEYSLFVQHDMFADSGFPQVVVPATKEAFLAFFAFHHFSHRQNLKVQLEVKPWGDDWIVVGHYIHKTEPEKWVFGYLRYNPPADMELPFIHTFDGEVDLFHNWETVKIRDRDAGIREHGDVLLWKQLDEA